MIFHVNGKKKLISHLNGKVFITVIFYCLLSVSVLSVPAVFTGCSKKNTVHTVPSDFIFNVVYANLTGNEFSGNFMNERSGSVFSDDKEKADKEKSLSAPSGFYGRQKYAYDRLAEKFFLRHTVSVRNRSFIYLFEAYNTDVTGLLDSSVFYSEACDDASWVEPFMSELNEEIAQENLSFMLTQLDDADSYTMESPYRISEHSFEEEDYGEAEIESIETVEQRWISSDKRLKFHAVNDEYFIPALRNGQKSFISVYKDNVSRSYYDDSYRLSKKEYWNIKNAENYALVKTDEYFYKKDGIIPEKKITVTENKKIISNYLPNGLVRRSDVYGIYQNPEEDETVRQKIEYLISKSLMYYNDDKKLTIEEITEYTYNSGSYEKPVSVMVRRQDYIYKPDENIPPDYKYYEDGKLKMDTVYESKGNYVNRIFFDDDFSVSSFFEDGKHVKDVYYFKGDVRREEIYE